MNDVNDVAEVAAMGDAKVDGRTKVTRARPKRKSARKDGVVKVKAEAVLPPSAASDYDCPSILNVVTKIVVDDDQFLPTYQTEGSACVDLIANLEEDHAGLKRVALSHRATVVIDCGFSMQLPVGYKACISARSSLANKGLIVTNGPGQIDSDYRGKVKVVVTNVGKEIVVIEHGDRFAQMWVEPVYLFEWVYANVLDPSDRGTGGFGSTGD